MMNLNQDTKPFRDKCLIKKKWGGMGKFQRVRKTYIKQTCMLKFNEFISKRNSMLFSRHAMFEILFNVLLTTYRF